MTNNDALREIELGGEKAWAAHLRSALIGEYLDRGEAPDMAFIENRVRREIKMNREAYERGL